MTRIWILVAAAACVFAAASAIILQLMPGPLRPMDYFVAGAVATLLALLALFIITISTSSKAKNIFFVRRKKDE